MSAGTAFAIDNNPYIRDQFSLENTPKKCAVRQSVLETQESFCLSCSEDL